MLFNVGLKRGAATWIMFGVIGSVLYMGFEAISMLRTNDDEQQKVSPAHLFYGQIGWPIMIPEAIEYTLAEFGFLTYSEIPSSSEQEQKLAGKEGNDDEPQVE